MKNLKMTLLAGAALFFASAPLLQAATAGHWTHKGFYQWHPQAGKTKMGSAGTQCYFCKPDPRMAPRPLDSDGDGVLDKHDKCPHTPKGAPVDRQGCWIVKNLNFNLDSAKILPKDVSTIRQTAHILHKNPGLNVEIQGHTDSTGTNAYNQALSNRRAHAVMNSLVKQGVNSRRLTARGYGEENPVVSNTTTSGRAENRRVVLKVRK